MKRPIRVLLLLVGACINGFVMVLSLYVFALMYLSQTPGGPSHWEELLLFLVLMANSLYNTVRMVRKVFSCS